MNWHTADNFLTLTQIFLHIHTPLFPLPTENHAQMKNETKMNMLESEEDVNKMNRFIII